MDQELVDLIRNEHAKTGREYREIIEAMRDEGNIAGTDQDMADLLGAVAPGHTDLMVTPEAIDKYFADEC